MKQENSVRFSNRLEELARRMRERALALEGNPEFTAKQLQSIELKRIAAERKAKLEDLKKTYFNAGRWAGGARDNVAREAFHKMNELEK
jgi:hypothetical protein